MSVFTPRLLEHGLLSGDWPLSGVRGFASSAADRQRH
jgi:hypothetical protein